jgi:iron complex transport system substrate-binding protein
MLGVNTLVGFPGTDYVSEETRKRIETGKVRVGKNENLNTEVLIDMKPDVIVGFD